MSTNEQEDERPNRKWFWAISSLLCFIFNALTCSINNHYYDDQTSKEHIMRMVNLLFSVTEIIPLIMGISCVGQWALTIGPKPLILVGLVLNSLSCTALGLTFFIGKSWIFLLVSFSLRFIQGFSTTIVLLPSLFIVFESFSKHRCLLLAILQFSSSIFFKIGTLMSFFLRKMPSLENPNIIFGSLSILNFFINLYILRNFPSQSTNQKSKNKKEPTKIFNNLKILLKKSEVHIIAATSFISFLFDSFFRSLIIYFELVVEDYSYGVTTCLLVATLLPLMMFSVLLGIYLDKSANAIILYKLGSLLNSALFLVIGLLGWKNSVEVLVLTLISILEGIFSMISSYPLYTALRQILNIESNEQNKEMDLAMFIILVPCMIIGQSFGTAISATIIEIIKLKTALLSIFGIYQLFAFVNFCCVGSHKVRVKDEDIEMHHLLARDTPKYFQLR